MNEQEVAPRFSLRLPMRYRPEGDPRWREAMTENLSTSGLRFVASEILPVGSKIEVEVTMTDTLLKASRVAAVSEVIRQGSEGQPLMTAVRHTAYNLESPGPKRT